MASHTAILSLVIYFLRKLNVFSDVYSKKCKSHNGTCVKKECCPHGYFAEACGDVNPNLGCCFFTPDCDWIQKHKGSVWQNKNEITTIKHNIGITCITLENIKITVVIFAA